jgi:hypothetical protein
MGKRKNKNQKILEYWVLVKGLLFDGGAILFYNLSLAELFLIQLESGLGNEFHCSLNCFFVQFITIICGMLGKIKRDYCLAFFFLFFSFC